MALVDKRASLTAIVLTVVWVGAIAGTLSAQKINLEFKDPIGDDNGPGTYTYPTDPVYTKGSFDMVSVAVKEKGDNVEFAITVRANLENPWKMDSGFSIQMAQIYLDMDHAAGSGITKALPGIYALFKEDEGWERAIIVSPQPRSRIEAEIKEKAPEWQDKLVIPLKVTPRGKTMIALVRKADLGGSLPATCGYQVVMTSNEGYPASYEMLTRRVNESAEQHRFGGGDDGEGDPHFMDMLYPPAQGTKEEVKGQHETLASYKSDEDDPAKNVLAVIPMVYPTN